MLIIAYLVVVVIVILLLVVFNVRTAKKRKAPPAETAGGEDSMDEAVREGTVGREEPNPIAVATLEKGAAGFADLSADAGEKPRKSDWKPGAEERAEAGTGARRSPTGMDVSFRGALRDMSSGDKRRSAAFKEETARTGSATINDNDYRDALRKMKRERRDGE
ncbi:hypothetical protein [Cohnella thailandensis]|uniref:Uncharacterized protein n=1 Tax=Cohnella thailandensis TaxID=557557 RepID=A0A841SSA4_9BACL|nr:hypothetical protein [Cohnella thailandensis]MBB6634092.1 hypothetical protein [Cohnella thailandensis]MBP1972416.1 putative membrane protein [Cohnella thailandensis]